jgi:hypothetical protein
VIDPAFRRAAIWLTLQVIACPAPPARLNAMRLGRSPQVDFLGPWQHEGLAFVHSMPDWSPAGAWDRRHPKGLRFRPREL